MSYDTLLDVIHDPLFAPTDLRLRRGCHISADSDAFACEFLRAAQPHLEGFYAAYGVQLVCGQEGYFYLLPDRNAVPPPLGRRSLNLMEMLAGQALALMRHEPEWLAGGGWVTELRILELLEHLLGREKLLGHARKRQRGRDDEFDARKLREDLGKALKTLERLGFVKREGRGEKAQVRPLIAVMRFVDPVRSSEPLGPALERLIREGEIEQIADESSEGGEVEDDTGEA